MATDLGNASATPTQPFWAALRDGRWVLQQCQNCARHQLYPRLLCRFCNADTLGWVDAAPEGTVIAAVLTHRTSAPDMQEHTPYQVLLIRLDDGPQLLATTEHDLLPAGSRVHIDLVETARSGRMTVTHRETP